MVKYYPAKTKDLKYLSSSSTRAKQLYRLCTCLMGVSTEDKFAVFARLFLVCSAKA
jgi:hypothetical protein